MCQSAGKPYRYTEKRYKKAEKRINLLYVVAGIAKEAPDGRSKIVSVLPDLKGLFVVLSRFHRHRLPLQFVPAVIKILYHASLNKKVALRKFLTSFRVYCDFDTWGKGGLDHVAIKSPLFLE